MNQRHRVALANKYQSDGMAAASPPQLLLAVFDRMRRDLEAATAAIESHEIEVAHRRLINAQELVYELQLALDVDVWPGATDLRSIYDHLMSLLIDANLTKSVETIRLCTEIVVPLEDSWIAANQRLHSGEGPKTARAANR